VLLNRCSLSSI
jgi:hypothetical protein